MDVILLISYELVLFSSFEGATDLTMSNNITKQI